jgi:hypothetical protein
MMNNISTQYSYTGRCRLATMCDRFDGCGIEIKYTERAREVSTHRSEKSLEGFVATIDR